MNEHLMSKEEFDKLPVGVIRTGIISNTTTGAFMTRDESLPLLKFVVVKRIEGRWTAYLGKMEQSYLEIENYGDKSRNPLYQRRMFPCVEEVFKMYAP